MIDKDHQETHMNLHHQHYHQYKLTSPSKLLHKILLKISYMKLQSLSNIKPKQLLKLLLKTPQNRKEILMLPILLRINQFSLKVNFIRIIYEGECAIIYEECNFLGPYVLICDLHPNLNRQFNVK